MIDLMLTQYKALSQTLNHLWANQLQLLSAQCRLGMQLGDAAMGRFGQAMAEESSLEKRMRERLAKGLAPPREIYDVRNRNRIDWSQVPDWARSTDPEAFEDCGHEG